MWTTTSGSLKPPKQRSESIILILWLDPSVVFSGCQQPLWSLGPLNTAVYWNHCIQWFPVFIGGSIQQISSRHDPVRTFETTVLVGKTTNISGFLRTTTLRGCGKTNSDPYFDVVVLFLVKTDTKPLFRSFGPLNQAVFWKALKLKSF